MISTFSDHPEFQYLLLVKNVIQKGEERRDRTGTGTRSLFSPPPLKFDSNSFPLLTTKRVPFKAVFEELMWFISGKTDAGILQKKGVKIWDGNSSRAALDRAGLVNNREGDLGPVYGFQWRHFGAVYTSADADYTGQGVDQIRDVIDKIKNSPMDRRILISAWNPADLKIMALPPCHLLCQFYVSFVNDTPKLSCHLYQRSADIGLGVPFNIASYALLNVLIAYVTGCEVGTLTITLGDAHVYLDHIEALETQIARVPRGFPQIEIVNAVEIQQRREWSVKYAVQVLEQFEYSNIKIVGYDPHEKIQMKMSV